MFDITDLYQQMINDHGKTPRNFGKLEDANHEAEGFNPLCGDKLHIYLKVGDDGMIQKVSFEGEGCRISLASASLMTEALRGRPIKDFQPLFEAFQHMVTADVSESPDEAHLGKLAVLAGVREFPARIKCATLCWHTFKSAMKGDSDMAKTE